MHKRQDTQRAGPCSARHSHVASVSRMLCLPCRLDVGLMAQVRAGYPPRQAGVAPPNLRTNYRQGPEEAQAEGAAAQQGYRPRALLGGMRMSRWSRVLENEKPTARETLDVCARQFMVRRTATGSLTKPLARGLGFRPSSPAGLPGGRTAPAVTRHTGATGLHSHWAQPSRPSQETHPKSSWSSPSYSGSRFFVSCSVLGPSVPSESNPGHASATHGFST